MVVSFWPLIKFWMVFVASESLFSVPCVIVQVLCCRQASGMVVVAEDVRINVGLPSVSKGDHHHLRHRGLIDLALGHQFKIKLIVTLCTLTIEFSLNS